MYRTQRMHPKCTDVRDVYHDTLVSHAVPVAEPPVGGTAAPALVGGTAATALVGGTAVAALVGGTAAPAPNNSSSSSDDEDEEGD